MLQPAAPTVTLTPKPIFFLAMAAEQKIWRTNTFFYFSFLLELLVWSIYGFVLRD